MGELDGRSGLVTGGAAGIGRSIAKRTAAEGSFVLVCDIDEEGGASCVEEIRKHGGRAHFTRTDISVESQVIELLAAAREFGGDVHWACNNAMGGSRAFGPLDEVTAEDWDSGLGVTLTGTFFCLKHELRSMLETGGGSIVNISSIAGIIASGNYVSYNTAKAAVRHLSKSIALHCAKTGGQIRCNSVHPVFINTPILDRTKEMFGEEQALAKLGRQIPMGKVGEPDDIAYAVLYLASDESKLVTGAELKVDGGISAM